MLRDELELPIPREEVEEIHQVVMSELEKLQPGCLALSWVGKCASLASPTIWIVKWLSSYRRGKEKSNDVDIVIGHPDLKSGSDKIKDLCKRFIQHLHSNGMVTHVMRAFSVFDHCSVVDFHPV
jgi:DNA polymerase IV